MAKQIEFYFDFGSPTTYLAWKMLPSIAKRYDAEIRYMPILLGGLLKAVGNHAPTDVVSKAAWFKQDIERCARRLGVPFHWNSKFPINSMLMMRACAGLLGTPEFDPLLKAAFEGFWLDGLDMAADEVIDRQLRKHSLDPASLREIAARAEIKTTLKERTEAAAARGVFGCPTMVVGSRLAFGQDRLVDVEEALNAA
jgi:2-hydroxychromene-2-carboxylate isomerase